MMERLPFLDQVERLVEQVMLTCGLQEIHLKTRLDYLLEPIA